MLRAPAGWNRGTCAQCGEEIEMQWNDGAEEWVLLDAVSAHRQLLTDARNELDFFPIRLNRLETKSERKRNEPRTKLERNRHDIGTNSERHLNEIGRKS